MKLIDNGRAHIAVASRPRHGRLRTKGFTALAAAVEQRPQALLWIVATLVAVVTFGLRAVFLGRSFDIFFDEVVYFRISQNVERALHVTYVGGVPFYLHPPLFFLLEGAYLKLLQPAGNIIHQIYAVRYLNIAIAGLSAAILFLLARRIGGWRASLVAAALFALEPFVILVNSRNLLETWAMFWVLLGYYNMTHLTHTPPSRRHIMGAGVSFGAALMTKEPMAFLTLLPLGILFILNWSIPRRATVLIGAIASVIYAFYPLAVAMTGTWGEFEKQKFSGLYRVSGVIHETPIRAHGITFTEMIARQTGQFASTYALLGCGAIAVCFLLLNGSAMSRLVAVVTGSAYLFQAYSIKFGSNEEQYYYYPLVLAILATAIAGVLVFQTRRLNGVALTYARVIAMLSLLTFAGWTSYQWAVRHFTPDNGYERLFSYLEQHVIGHGRIAATNLTTAALLNYYNVSFGPWGTPQEVRDNHAQYAIISTLLIAQGYDMGTPQLQDWLAHHARLAFVFAGPTNGRLELYRIPPARHPSKVPVGVEEGGAPTGMSAPILLNPVALTFGRQGLHTTSPAQTIHIVNIGSRRLVIAHVAISGPQAADFDVRTTCTSGAIAVIQACTISVRFTPTGHGERGATVTFVDNRHTRLLRTIPVSGRA